MKLKIILGLLVIFLLIKFTITAHVRRAFASQINVLDYFLSTPDHQVELCEDKNNDKNCDGLIPEENRWGEKASNLKIGNALFISKWRNPNTYEYYTWDDNYIYLRYDSSWPTSQYKCNGQGTSYTLSDGRWLKRNMEVGEKVESQNNQVRVYDKTNCSICFTENGPYKVELENRNPSYNFGGDIGVQDTLIVKYTSNLSIPDTYEKFYYAKNWGFIKWEFYENGVKKYDINRNKISGGNPVYPIKRCMAIPCTTVSPPSNLKYQCSADFQTVTLSWDSVLGTSYYPLRVDDKTTGEWNDTCHASTGDFCQDQLVDNFYTFNVTPCHHYNWWVHGLNTCGAWTSPADGPDFTCCPSPTPTSTPTPVLVGTLSFRLKFQGISHQAGNKNIRLILKQVGVEKYRFDSVSVSADTNGVYSGTISNITPGTYDIFLKGPAHLQKEFANITLNSGTNNFDWSATPLKAGDFDNNNILNITDISNLLSKYIALIVPVTTANQKFDIDGNNVININDISLVLANYTALEVPGE